MLFQNMRAMMLSIFIFNFTFSLLYSINDCRCYNGLDLS